MLLSFLLSVINFSIVVGSNYEIWCQGTCNSDAKPTSTQGGVVLMGGGVSRCVFSKYLFHVKIHNPNRKTQMKHLFGKLVMPMVEILLSCVVLVMMRTIHIFMDYQLLRELN